MLRLFLATTLATCLALPGAAAAQQPASQGGAPGEPKAGGLLPAPRLWTGIRLWVRRPVKLNFTRLEGASSYRLLVAKRADFSEVIFTDILKNNEIALPELDNGPYFLKIRGIDSLGREGRETNADLVLALSPVDPSAAGSPATPAAAGPWSVDAPKKSP